MHPPILIIFGRNVGDKVSNQRCFIVPPHLASAFVIAGKTENWETERKDGRFLFSLYDR